MAKVHQEQQKIGDIAAALLAHYDQHARVLPWRAPPGTPPTDPYRIWLSEIMLQQTTVAAVIPYFERFTRRWPDFAALAAANDADVMAEWAGLGYYARARNLLKCARVVTTEHGGNLPNTAMELAKLPGIGPYTAAAIAAIGFGERTVVIDANVERVASRLFAIQTPLPASKPEIRVAVDAITPHARPGDFAQAMMDLGATICTARSPACHKCPLGRNCRGVQMGIAAELPRKAPKAAKPARHGTAYFIERDGKVWLVTRPATGMLAAMRALPDDRWSARKDGDGAPPLVASWRMLDTKVVHVFTHFSLELGIAISRDAVPTGEGMWWPLKTLDSAGLPTLFSRAAKLALIARKMGD